MGLRVGDLDVGLIEGDRLRVGAVVGLRDGSLDGSHVGIRVGRNEGENDGAREIEGKKVGEHDGRADVGRLDGKNDGIILGSLLGVKDGIFVRAVGSIVGWQVGVSEGNIVGGAEIICWVISRVQVLVSVINIYTPPLSIM